jgi:glycine betaine/L-proline transport ATP binding subunit
LIVFEQVIKKYNNQDKAAVDNLDLHIQKGEICMLVGPSGCGKTTTMKMINKLIKATSGKIYIDGMDIDQVDPINLRLDIGYVIQDTGLFPHMTIADNIATVPKEKGWSRNKIRNRVDELLELMDLDPEIYRDKKPKDLSGGQKQRVGVARALAADPPVMLMDEPFGALDPITRGKLQDEFLRIQEKIGKTIVFVTHDIDEALKMGDKIVVMRDGRVVQFGSPNEILSNPADEFVSELIGGNSNLKMMNLMKCKDIMRLIPNVDSRESSKAALKIANEHDVKNLLVTDHGQKLLGYVSYGSLASNDTVVSNLIKEIGETVTPKTTLQDVLSKMFSLGKKTVFVSGTKGTVEGIVTMDDLLKAVKDDEQISESDI